VNLRFLFAMLVALAMALAPVSMPLGEASAADTSHQDMAMAEEGHCSEQQPAEDQADKGKPCCAAGCMAAATLPSVADEAIVLPGETGRPGLDRFRGGIPEEIATPPPRLG
jgi:hypothetical protein